MQPENARQERADPRAGMKMNRRPLGECLARALSPKVATDEQWSQLLALVSPRSQRDLAEFNDFRFGEWLNAITAKGRAGEIGRERFLRSFGSPEWVQIRARLAGTSKDNENTGGQDSPGRGWPHSFTAQAKKLIDGIESRIDYGREHAEGSRAMSAAEAEAIALAARHWAQAWLDIRIERQTGPDRAPWMVAAFQGVGAVGLLPRLAWEEKLRAARDANPGFFEGLAAHWEIPRPAGVGSPNPTRQTAELLRARETVAGRQRAAEWARWIGKGAGAVERVKWLQSENLLDDAEWAKLATLRALSGEARAFLESQWIKAALSATATANLSTATAGGGAALMPDDGSRPDAPQAANAPARRL